MPSTLPAYSTDSQTTPYLPTSSSIHLEPQSSTPYILIPIVLGDIKMVTTDHQQCQPLIWVPFPPIPNHLKLHPHSYICTTIDHLPNNENLDVIQQFLNKPTPTSQ